MIAYFAGTFNSTGTQYSRPAIISVAGKYTIALSAGETVTAGIGRFGFYYQEPNGSLTQNTTWDVVDSNHNNAGFIQNTGSGNTATFIRNEIEFAAGTRVWGSYRKVNSENSAGRVEVRLGVSNETAAFYQQSFQGHVEQVLNW